MRIFGQKKSKPADGLDAAVQAAREPSDRDMQAVDMASGPMEEPVGQEPVDRREGGRRDSYDTEPADIREDAQESGLDQGGAAGVADPPGAPRPRVKILPGFGDASDLHFGAGPAGNADNGGGEAAAEGASAGMPANGAEGAAQGEDSLPWIMDGPAEEPAPMDGPMPMEGEGEDDGDAEPLPEGLEPADEEEAFGAGNLYQPGPEEYPTPVGGMEPWPPAGIPGPVNAAYGESGEPGKEPVPEKEEFPGTPDAPTFHVAGHAEPDPAPAPTRFEPVIDTDPVPADLTFSSLSSIMSSEGDVVRVALVDDPGAGSEYALADALLKYGNCRVVKVDSVIADGRPRLVYRVMLRDEPVSKRLHASAFPLPYDVPCWRIGNRALLYMSLPANGNGAMPCHEAVECRIVDAVRGEDRTTVTVMTRGGATIEGIPIDRLFLPGTKLQEKPELSDDALCERLADGMAR